MSLNLQPYQTRVCFKWYIHRVHHYTLGAGVGLQTLVFQINHNAEKLSRTVLQGKHKLRFGKQWTYPLLPPTSSPTLNVHLFVLQQAKQRNSLVFPVHSNIQNLRKMLAQINLYRIDLPSKVSFVSLKILVFGFRVYSYSIEPLSQNFTICLY